MTAIIIHMHMIKEGIIKTYRQRQSHRSQKPLQANKNFSRKLRRKGELGAPFSPKQNLLEEDHELFWAERNPHFYNFLMATIPQM